MIVTRISITREGFYSYSGSSKPDASKPLRATVEIYGDHGKTELNLPPDTSDMIVALIADKIAESGRETAKLLTAKALEAMPAAKQLSGAK